MSNLYASIKGNRSERTCCVSSSISAHIRGWDDGVRVEARYHKDGSVFNIYITGGSNGSRCDELAYQYNPKKRSLTSDTEK